MHIVNKNKILDVYYNEASPKDKKITKNHIKECSLCAEYYESLFVIEKKLNYLTESEPDEMVLTNVLGNIDSTPQKVVQSKNDISGALLFHISLGLVLLSVFVYLVVVQLSTIPLWQLIKKHWFMQIFGSVGIPVLIILTIGTFITIALTPILILELNNSKSNNLT